MSIQDAAARIAADAKTWPAYRRERSTQWSNRTGGMNVEPNGITRDSTHAEILNGICVELGAVAEEVEQRGNKRDDAIAEDVRNIRMYVGQLSKRAAQRAELSAGERHVQEELANICKNEPVFPGDTISHATANECVRRGLARRDANGNFVTADDPLGVAAQVWCDPSPAPAAPSEPLATTDFDGLADDDPLGVAAQVWCDPEISGRIVDPFLTAAFARVLIRDRAAQRLLIAQEVDTIITTYGAHYVGERIAGGPLPELPEAAPRTDAGYLPHERHGDRLGRVLGMTAGEVVADVVALMIAEAKS